MSTLVMVIDDSPVVRKIIEVTLRREGMEVVSPDQAMYETDARRGRDDQPGTASGFAPRPGSRPDRKEHAVSQQGSTITEAKENPLSWRFCRERFL
jgi:CheY-like chemotaxis protein